MGQVIDYLNSAFTVPQLIAFGVLAVVLIAAVVVAIVVGCRKSKKKKAGKKEEERRQEELRDKKERLLAQVDADIRLIDTAIEETTKNAALRKAELNDEENIIAESEDVLNAADEAKYRELADKENALSSLYKKQTTGPFKSFRKKKAAITLDTLEDVQAEKGDLSDAIEARNRDRVYRKEILEKNLALIDTDAEVRIYNLKAQKAELELKKHEIEKENASAPSTQKMTVKEAKRYAVEANRKKKAEQEEEERRAKEEVRIAKEAYEKEKQRRVQTEKEVELALATLRDSEKEKRRRENDERKRARKAQYMHPVAIHNNDVLLLEYEEEKVNTIIADAEDESVVVAETPAETEIVVQTETSPADAANEGREEISTATGESAITEETGKTEETETVSPEESAAAEEKEAEIPEAITEEPKTDEKAEEIATAPETPSETEEIGIKPEAPAETEDEGTNGPDVSAEAEESVGTTDDNETVAETAEETSAPETTEETVEETAEEPVPTEETVEETTEEPAPTEETVEETAEETVAESVSVNEETAPDEEKAETETEVSESMEEVASTEETTQPTDTETDGEAEETAEAPVTAEQNEAASESSPAEETVAATGTTEDEIAVAADASVEEIAAAEAAEEPETDLPTEETEEPIPEKPVKLYYPIYNDGIPATPINKKNKYQKPLTKIVVKDPSKRRYDDLPAAKLAASKPVRKPSAAALKRNEELEKQAETCGKWTVEQDDIYFVAELFSSDGIMLMRTEKYTSLSGIKNGIETIRKNIEAGNVNVVADSRGRSRFKVFSSGNRLLAIGDSYENSELCEQAIESAKRFCETAVLIRK
ncbi:MAG: hypothetical protein SOT34_07680 [Candidatus Borkfalkiaceae bacterium]|nr:hypothetical protein [Christensenellaceae bacterium]